jgi:hypothetical protein
LHAERFSPLGEIAPENLQDFGVLLHEAELEFMEASHLVCACLRTMIDQDHYRVVPDE